MGPARREVAISTLTGPIKDELREFLESRRRTRSGIPMATTDVQSGRTTDLGPDIGQQPSPNSDGSSSSSSGSSSSSTSSEDSSDDDGPGGATAAATAKTLPSTRRGHVNASAHVATGINRSLGTTAATPRKMTGVPVRTSETGVASPAKGTQRVTSVSCPVDMAALAARIQAVPLAERCTILAKLSKATRRALERHIDAEQRAATIDRLN